MANEQMGRPNLIKILKRSCTFANFDCCEKYRRWQNPARNPDSEAFSELINVTSRMGAKLTFYFNGSRPIIIQEGYIFLSIRQALALVQHLWVCEIREKR